MAFVKSLKQNQEGVSYGEVLDRYAKLHDVKNLTGDKLCFARSKNLMHLRNFEKANSHTARIPVTKEFEAYQKELGELQEKHLLADSGGHTVLQNGNPVVDIANPGFVSENSRIRQKYKAAIQEREDDIKAYNEFLQEVVPQGELPNSHSVKMEDVSSLSQDQMDAVIWFITE